jgi:hypothetical protein
MREASSSQTISGRFATTVQVKGQVLTAQAKVHRGADRAVTEYLSGRYQGWKVVEEDGLVWRVDPQGKPRPGQGLSEAPRPAFRPGVGSLVVRRSLVRSRVAGRRAERYVISPAGVAKARAVLDLDAVTGFPLAAARYGTQGEALSRTTFEEIAFGGPPPARQPVPDVAQAREPTGRGLRTQSATEAQLAAALGGGLLRPATLPQGFSPAGSYLARSPSGAIAELRYSDGLRVVVLLQMDLRQRRRSAGAQARGAGPQPPDQHRARAKQPWERWFGARRRDEEPGGKGAVLREALRSRLRGHSLHERRGTRLVVVAGDLAPDELQRIMDSIPYPPERATKPSRTRQ